MKGVVWHGPERMAVEEVPEPALEAGHVVLRPEAAGICGSEVEGYLGRMGNRVPPLIMGHEFAGTVVEVGEGVDPEWIGRRAAVNPLISCGECRLCRLGLTNLCRERALIGIQHPGAFAEYVKVPAGSLYPLPEGVSARTGALAEPLANGVHAVRLGTEGREPVEHAVVIGAGTIGIMVAQAAVLAGISWVGVVEPHAGRRELARRLGAHAVFGSAEEARGEVLEIAAGLGADLVLDAVGAAETRRQAVELLRPGGTAILVGLHDDETSVGFHGVVRNQVALRGSYAYTGDDFGRALSWLVEGRAGIGELPPVQPLERGPEIFAGLVQGPAEQVKVFLAGSEG